jgi:hypothetical protein
LSRGGCHNRWNSLVDCNHRDPITSRTCAPPPYLAATPDHAAALVGADARAQMLPGRPHMYSEVGPEGVDRFRMFPRYLAPLMACFAPVSDGFSPSLPLPLPLPLSLSPSLPLSLFLPPAPLSVSLSLSLPLSLPLCRSLSLSLSLSRARAPLAHRPHRLERGVPAAAAAPCHARDLQHARDLHHGQPPPRPGRAALCRPHHRRAGAGGACPGGGRRGLGLRAEQVSQRG